MTPNKHSGTREDGKSMSDREKLIKKAIKFLKKEWPITWSHASRDGRESDCAGMVISFAAEQQRDNEAEIVRLKAEIEELVKELNFTLGKGDL